MKSFFPASYSTLCPKALSSLLSEKYHLENVLCELIVRGVGDTYLITSTAGCFILRAYRSSHRSLPQIQAEVQLLLALKQAGVSVSYPIEAVSGEMMLHFDAIEGKRHAVLFSYAPGNTVAVLNESQLRLLGREMARFHQVSNTIELEKERWVFDVDTTLYKPLQMLKPVFAEDNEGYIWLQQAAERVAHKLIQLNAFTFSKGYCHFDFLPKNFHFEGDSITLFDFDFMGFGWLVFDIASFWQHLAISVYAGRMTQEAMDTAYAILLDEYRRHKAISEAELAAVPYLALGFWLFYMSFHTTHDQFYSFTQPSQVKVYTGFLKHMAGAYWDKEGV